MALKWELDLVLRLYSKEMVKKEKERSVAMVPRKAELQLVREKERERECHCCCWLVCRYSLDGLFQVDSSWVRVEREQMDYCCRCYPAIPGSGLLV
jgi:hypothetical protein